MHRDYQAIGLCDTVITSTAGALTPDTSGFMTIICIEAGDLTGVTSRFPRASVTVDGAISVSAGTVLYSIATATISTGTWQVIYHKS